MTTEAPAAEDTTVKVTYPGDDSALFSGSITLNRRDHDDVELYRKLRLGREVEFTVTGNVAGDAETIKARTEKKPERLVGKRTVRVHTLEPRTDDDTDPDEADA